MDTTCPGDQWAAGANWKNRLHQEIQAVKARGGKPLEYCLLFWDHGDSWAEADYRNAQDYIAHFRPAIAFVVDDAKAAQHVVIVGGDAGISGPEEASLRQAGCSTYRLAGANEAETKSMLTALVRQNTPYPGATPQAGSIRADRPSDAVTLAEEPVSDEWTIPDEWLSWDVAPPTRVLVDLFGLAEPDGQP
jgi:hypothetical protein